MTDDDRIIIAGGNARAKRFPVLLGKIVFSSNKNVRAGIKLLEFSAPLFGQAVRDNKHGLVGKAEPTQLHCACCHCPRFSRANAMCEQCIAAIQNAGYSIALVFAQIDIGVHARKGEVVPVERARPCMVKACVVIIHQPCASVWVSVYPILKCLP